MLEETLQHYADSDRLYVFNRTNISDPEDRQTRVNGRYCKK